MKLKKEQQQTVNTAIAQLQAAHKEFAPAVEAYNAAIASAHSALLDALEPYNEALDLAADDIRGVGAELSDDWGEKTQRWQESDKGTAAADFIARLEQFTIDQFVVDAPEEIKEPEDHVEEVDELLSEDD